MNEASAMFLYPSVSWWCWWWHQEEEEGRRRRRKLMRVSLSRRPPPPPPSCLQSIPLPSFTSSSFSFFFCFLSRGHTIEQQVGFVFVLTGRATNRPTPPFVSSRQPSRLNSHSQPSAWYRYPMISISRPSRRGQDYLSLFPINKYLDVNLPWVHWAVVAWSVEAIPFLIPPR